MSPRRRQASVLEAEPESEGGWATYLYEGEDKFCRDNPIARTDLLLDSGRLLHLCHLTESLVPPPLFFPSSEREPGRAT
jgi:hypothetical protein